MPKTSLCDMPSALLLHIMADTAVVVEGVPEALFVVLHRAVGLLDRVIIVLQPVKNKKIHPSINPSSSISEKPFGVVVISRQSLVPSPQTFMFSLIIETERERWFRVFLLV